MMLIIVFWLSLLGAAFSYFLYPLILSLFPSRRGSKDVQPSGLCSPRVTLIVTAHNEEGRIREKIENCLALDYRNLEILIASDASTDSTDQIVKEYGTRGVKLARAEERKGKEYAQLQAISCATGDILVFSDVATSIPEDAIGRMVRYFDDPAVGAVSSEDRFISRDGIVAGEGAYVRYEMWLRGLESKKAGLVGLSGSFFAARRSVCDEWDIYSPSDFNTALSCARRGMVAVTAPNVFGYYTDVSDAAKEYQRKVRTIIRGLTALSRHPDVLNPATFGLFAFQVFGHKVMRWAAPWFQVVLYVISLMLSVNGFIYSVVFAIQSVFYGLALAGHGYPELRNFTVVKIPYFFVQVNLAVAHASVSFVSGHRMTVWAPSQR
ncbi:glycosyltransferase family 2 protein [uncultured Marinobacter sp.]|uniref:glycosyltransferase family 2 protein n=1 Tax=uncultured Marinobacter sp. TaxID=187379 RepID=UPI002614CC4A|nr:glycosyltransferase family 2 protein [uncultured Marinobacter sp.]